MPAYAKTADRQELSDFLKTRRERLRPQDVGLPMTPRRRTPGLRREEVAQLAAVGITWYTWFEQGRAVDVSAHFLERIAQALRLDGAERAHLFSLAQNRPPPSRPAPGFVVTPAHRRMLEAIQGPAYIATAPMDVLAWNAALSAVFGDIAHLADEDRNMLWLMFASAEHRAAIPDWETAARAMLARFRGEYGRSRDDPRFQSLIDRLQAASAEFREWWPAHDVTVKREKPKRFAAPEVGEMALEQNILLLENAPGMRLVVYAPADDDTAAKVAQLTRRWRAR